MVLWAVLENQTQMTLLLPPPQLKFTSSFESSHAEACFKVIHYGRATHSRSH